MKTLGRASMRSRDARALPLVWLILGAAVSSGIACNRAAAPANRDAGASRGEQSAAPDAAVGPDPGPPKRLYVRRFIVNVRSAPSRDAPRIGYLRAGAVLRAKTSRPVGNERCPRDGWYELETGGFVCAGFEVIAFEGRRLPERPPAQPDLDARLPYAYGVARRHDVPMYRRLPTDEEAAQYEGYVIPGSGPSAQADAPPTQAEAGAAPASAETVPHVANEAGAGSTPSATASIAEASARAPVSSEPAASVPATAAGVVPIAGEPGSGDPALAEEQGPPTLASLQGEAGSVLLRRMMKGFAVSLDREVRIGRRRYWRTQMNGFVPFDRLIGVRGSAFSGFLLSEAGPSLPVGWVMNGRARRWNRRGERMSAGGPVPWRTPVVIAGEERWRERSFVVSADGWRFRVEDLVVIRPRPRPNDVGENEKWIDVDLTSQTLVAYEGDRPVYATLVSTGRVKDESVEELNHETPVGEFRITSKHVSHTMDGDHAVDGPYSIEDVPYVMYFQLAYALHSAFWHDRFGRPRSHGCVNLAPDDARWLFRWTDPPLPPGWHGVYPTPERPGTRLYIRGVTPRG
ncbi:MAG: L,D-transpeptidase family protein [Myxococcota bacterium]|nr:L,D-transpeptidase family protein [Myxococcota bacterium]MDW8362203.1 L,D-transpeptidase family protein [Myxococcales bacterium]